MLFFVAAATVIFYGYRRGLIAAVAVAAAAGADTHIHTQSYTPCLVSLPLQVGISLLFGGFLVTRTSIPVWMLEFYYVSPFSWSLVRRDSDLQLLVLQLLLVRLLLLFCRFCNDYSSHW